MKKASADQTIFRRLARDAGYKPIPTGADKAPVYPSWSLLLADEVSLASWAADPLAIGTGIVLGSSLPTGGRTRRGGFETTFFCRAGDTIGIDLDLDDPADRALFDKIVAFLAARLATPGPLVTVGRADGGTTSRVKILLRAVENFPEGTPLAKTVHFDGHLSPLRARQLGRSALSRSIEAYAAGRQFVVSGPNVKAGCEIEIRVDGVLVDFLPPAAILPGITAAAWCEVLAFIDQGLGVPHSANERALPAANTGPGTFAPVLVDPERGVVIDGRETAITRAAYAAHAKVIDSPTTPFELLENPGSRLALATALAWRVVERDVDLTRPRDGGSGSDSFWTIDDVAERVARADRANAEHHLADRRQREAFGPNAAAMHGASIDLIADVLAAHTHPLIDRRHLEEARHVEEGAMLAEAKRLFEDYEEARADALRVDGLIPDGAIRLASDPLVFGFVTRSEISVLYGPSSIGKTSLAASWGFACAAGLHLDPANPPTAVAAVSGGGGQSFTHFDHEAAHVMIACEGGQVVDPVKRGLEAELTDAANFHFPGAAVMIPERPIPEWWAAHFPTWCQAVKPDGSIGWSEALHPRRYLKYYGIDASPGFLILDALSAEALFSRELGQGHALVFRDRNAIVENQGFIELVKSVAIVSSLRHPVAPNAPLADQVAARRPVVMSIDNLLEVCPAGEDHEAVAKLYHVVGKINRVANAGTVLLHHTTKSGDSYAGSASVFRYASTVVEVIRDPDDSDMRLFHHQKLRLPFQVPNTFSVAQYNRKARTAPVYLTSNVMHNPAFRAALDRAADGGAFYGSFNTFNFKWGADIVDELHELFAAKGKPKPTGPGRVRPRFEGSRPPRPGAVESSGFGAPPATDAGWVATALQTVTPASSLAGLLPSFSAPAALPLAPTVPPPTAAPLSIPPILAAPPPAAPPILAAPPPAAPPILAAPPAASGRPSRCQPMPGNPLFVVRVSSAPPAAAGRPASPPPPAASRPASPPPPAASRRATNRAIEEARVWLWPHARRYTCAKWVMPEEVVKAPKAPTPPKPKPAKPAPDMSPLPMTASPESVAVPFREMVRRVDLSAQCRALYEQFMAEMRAEDAEYLALPPLPRPLEPGDPVRVKAMIDELIADSIAHPLIFPEVAPAFNQDEAIGDDDIPF